MQQLPPKSEFNKVLEQHKIIFLHPWIKTMSDHIQTDIYWKPTTNATLSFSGDRV
jgi:hypothetical protein